MFSTTFYQKVGRYIESNHKNALASKHFYLCYKIYFTETFKLSKKFYLTTAIAYTSAKPHIGNTYEAILADSIARFKKKQGYDVFLQTGTDEHGQKIEEKALSAGKTPKEFVDGVAAEIKRLSSSSITFAAFAEP